MAGTFDAYRWLDRIIADPAVDTVCAKIAAGQHRTFVHGSRGSSTTLWAGALAVRMRRPVLLVVAHPDEAEDAFEDLGWFESTHALARLRFPALEVLPGETGVSLDLLGQRLQVVERLQEQRTKGQQAASNPTLWVAPVQALMQSVPCPEVIAQWSTTLKRGLPFAPGRLAAWLVNAGYERVDAIEQPGQFAARGGVMDIYLPAGVVESGRDEPDACGGPVRLEFWGDEVESMNRIDPDTMGSGGRVEKIQIVGAAADQLQSDSDTTSFLSLLADGVVVVMHEMLELAEQARGYYERLTNPRGIYPPRSVFEALAARTHVQVNQYSQAAGSDDAAVSLPVGLLPGFGKDAASAVRELAGLVTGRPLGLEANGSQTPVNRVVVLCDQPAQRDRLVELIGEQAAEAEVGVTMDVGYLHRGFVWGDSGGPLVYLVPHHELFHRYEYRRRVRSGLSLGGGRASDAFLEVEAGDFVVHADHGVARFSGLCTLRRRDLVQEYLTLEFANQATLHVPAVQVELVQKYVGGFQGKPPLSQLGGKRWARQKAQVAEAVKDLAAELLRVQAARASMPGIRYPPDTPWQRRFEAEFPYQETEDQLAAIAKVKKDMQHHQPMDRLVCGDVGFGKTEIAVRAAFKAVGHGKQVAVLVPTTVLAEQHEQTFRGRMADYPFRVESISRFKTTAEARSVLKDLAQGRVDIMIGTHRLLSDDVRFADLGLVVVDEEQRFGVEHKQKLMRLRLTVDVLTLSATPIPRTLHMAMMGLRDISSLTTPPLDRQAIVTEVVAYDAQRVRHAVIRELNRDGQVYYVHNRVRSINRVANEIRKLVPEAKVAVGHGQMPGRELEQVMLRFMRRQVDVLVCTTIIESGLDIPTANTIFIDGADHFGLSDLHQLRGRVGRYKHRAYCYLLLPADRPVTDMAAKRLRALERYAMLGAGFKIAMRDLEIRGAGNLLGSQQSGHIAAVGYEMYCRLLEHATQRLRNESVLQPAKTHVELPVSGRLPKRYIGSDKYRMEAYRRISRAVSSAELEGVAKDLQDGYGPLPEPARVFLDLAQLRVAAARLGVNVVKVDGPDVVFRLPKTKALVALLSGVPGRTSEIDPHTVYWRPPARYLEPPTLLAVLRKVLVDRVGTGGKSG